METLPSADAASDTVCVTAARTASPIDLPRLFLISERKVQRAPATPLRVEILRGEPEISRAWPLLVELSARTGQAEVVQWLRHFMKEPAAIKKIPHLVLVGLRPGVMPHDAGAEDVLGAALIYEYRFAGFRTHLYATDDITGQRTVIAAEADRRRVAEAACGELIERGATMTVATVASLPGAFLDEAQHSFARSASTIRTRRIPLYLPIESTLQRTLGLLGRHTRRNFRRYRLRAEAELGAAFVARVSISRGEFLAVDRGSTHPTTNDVASWRYDSIAQTTGSLLAGIRSADGRWLSLIGGRRRNDTTWIDWQINRAGLPQYSLGTVMRAFLLEEEVALGTTRLIFEGGTPHAMRHSFATMEATDILVRSRSLAASAITWLLPWVMPRRNFLANALRDRRLQWTGV